MEEPKEKEVEELDRQVGEGDVRTDVLRKISSLGMPEKMRLVNTTNKKKVRAILIKDSNKRIGLGVVKSANVTIAEIQDFARMKDLHTDILMSIADDQRYSNDRLIVWGLLNNPKMPVATGQRLIRKFSFTAKELASLAKNRDLPQGLRSMAMRMSQAKQH